MDSQQSEKHQHYAKHVTYRDDSQIDCHRCHAIQQDNVAIVPEIYTEANSSFTPAVVISYCCLAVAQASSIPLFHSGYITPGLISCSYLYRLIASLFFNWFTSRFSLLLTSFVSSCNCKIRFIIIIGQVM